MRKTDKPSKMENAKQKALRQQQQRSKKEGKNILYFESEINHINILLFIIVQTMEMRNL